jgi:hypothetical protein
MSRKTRWAAIVSVGVALVAGGTVHAVSAQASSVHTVTYYAFDINNGTSEPGLIPVAGTDPSVYAQGDALIINDQVTITHKVGGGYPIVGFDSGVCTITRIPEPDVDQTLANCDVTVAWRAGGSLTLQGTVSFVAQEPQAAVFAITGGTGNGFGASGSLHIAFTPNDKILTFTLK